MPKIFLTGSGISKGYVTGSGYLNNPVRTIVRDRDNRAGTYPTIHRMNRKGNAGILSNIVFDDTKTVKFGNAVMDDFTIEEEGVFSKPVNGSLWLAGNNEVLVRKEFDPSRNFELTTGAVVLGGSTNRWLRTKSKVANPTLNFSLLQGPYNDTGALARFKLNLGRGAVTDVFKVQTSIDGVAWTDVPLKNIHLGTTDAWVDSLIIDETSKHIVPRDVFELRKVFTALGAPSVGDLFKPILNIKLDIQDFAATGIVEPFYIRFVQPSISDATINVWALGNVNIISRDEQITYPYLGFKDHASLYHLSQSIASPNLINSLVASGSSLRGVTDSGALPFNDQKLLPFNEASVINVDNSGFFSVGTQEDVTPGFSQPLTSKTQFHFQMKPATNDVIALGLTRKGIGAAISLNNDDGQVLLSYWNFQRQAWEEIGQPLRDNRGNHADEAAAKAHLADNITGSCVGFGPIIDSLTTGPAGSMQLNSRKSFEHAYLPTSTFGFPFAAKYHATSSQYIKASDLGITKPFLLEKLSLDFDIEFAVPGHNADSDKDRDAYATINIDETNNTIAPYINRRFKIFTPTFFLLRQHLDSKNASVSSFSVTTPGAGSVGAASQQPVTVFEEIPKIVKLTSGSDVQTKVFDTRELVTYGQYNLFVTASAESHGNAPDRLNDSGISMTDVLNSGIVRDGFSVKSVADAQVDAAYTIKDRIDFPVRIAGQHQDVLSAIVHNNEPLHAVFPQDTSLISLENKCATRNLFLDGNSRAIVNGTTGLRRSDELLVVSQSVKTTKVSTFENLTFKSPYLIFPEDKLIFGWQYPMPRDLRFPTGAPSATPNAMKVQDCNLRMFGSQIKLGAEFHEGLNQNLTSTAVHEVIGNEPVVDQFEVGISGELTGSFADNYLLALNFRNPGNTTGTDGNILILGRNIPTLEEDLTNLSTGFTSDNSGQQQRRYEQSLNPVKRVNSVHAGTGPTSDKNIFSIIGDQIPGANFESRYGAFNQPGGKYAQHTQRYFNLTDVARIYKDSKILNLHGSHRPFNYGSYQNYTFYYPSSPTNVAVSRRIRGGGSPKYYFSRNSFGQFSDFIRQGLDSRFNLNQQDVIPGTIIDSAVRVRFVEDSYDEENLNFRKFTLVKPSDVDGTAYETFQSSNISLFATSSLPFFDYDHRHQPGGGVVAADLDNSPEPTNRNYSVSAVEVVV